MSEPKQISFKEFLPRKGLLHQEDVPTYALCKPKLMPLKSFTLEKLEKVQKEAQGKVAQARREEEEEEEEEEEQEGQGVVEREEY